MSESEQTSIFYAPPEKRCDTCDFFSALKEPRKRSDEAKIYGYCFKSGDKNYNTNMGKGYPVFIDEGSCKHWKRRKLVQK